MPAPRSRAQAQRSRAPIQKLVDTVSGYFVPAVVVIAALTFIIWGLFGPNPAMAFAIVNAVALQGPPGCRPLCAIPAVAVGVDEGESAATFGHQVSVLVGRAPCDERDSRT